MPKNGRPRKGAPRKTKSRNETSPPADKVAIVVAGMHRSGTSALSRVVSLLGADLPKFVMPGDANNEAGYWESVEVNRLNDAILESAGTFWHDFREFNSGWYGSSIARQFRKKALEALDREYSDSSFFVLKDPRFCRILPFWLDALKEFGAAPHLIVCLRNPLEIAESIRKRDGFDTHHVLLIWLRHLLDIEYASRGIPRAFSLYSSLLESWEEATNAIAKKLGISWPGKSSFKSIEIEKFLSKEYKHHNQSTNGVLRGAGVHHWVSTVFDCLSRLSNGTALGIHTFELDTVRREFADAELAFSKPLAVGESLRTEYLKIKSELAATTARLKEFETSVAEKLKDAEELRRDCENKSARVSELERVMEEKVGEINRLWTEIEKRDAEVVRLRSEIDSRPKEDEAKKIDALTSELDVSERRISEMETALKAGAVEIDRIADDSNRAADEIERLRNELAESKSFAEKISALKMEAEFNAAAVQATLDSSVEDYEKLRAKVESAINRARNSESSLFERDDELRKIGQKLHDAESKVSELSQIVERISVESERIRARTEASDARKKGIERALSDKRKAFERIEREAGLLEARLLELESEFRSEIARRDARIDDLQRREGELQSDRDRFKKALDGVLGSKSWKFTRPLRRLMAVASGEPAEPKTKLPWDGVTEAPAELRAEPAPVEAPAPQIDEDALSDIRSSPLFDSAYYLSQLGEHSAEAVDPAAHYLLNGARSCLDPHPLFDSFYYIERNDDVQAASHNPLLHYLRHGASELRNPHPLFDAKYYVAQLDSFDPESLNPLVHYIEVGAREQRKSHPLFDTAFYLQSNPDVFASGDNPLRHFVVMGVFEDRDPNPLFSTRYYLGQYPDVSERGSNPLVHYSETGWMEDRDPCPLFNTRYYVEHNQDVDFSAMNPLAHYFEIGSISGKDPCALFDSSFYLSENPDVAKSGTNPLQHYIEAGAYEGRNPHPMFESAYYLKWNPDVAGERKNPLQHFIEAGAYEGRRPNPLFYPDFYLEQNPDVAERGMNPLQHYAESGEKENRQPCPDHVLGDRDWLVYPKLKADIENVRRKRIDSFEPTPPQLLSFRDRDLSEVARSLHFDEVVNPKVSIVMPLYSRGEDQIRLTLECLYTLDRGTQGIPYEVVIGDDGSCEKTKEIISEVFGINFYASDKNLGFLRAVNRAANFAKGEFIVLLNNDVQLMPGWLEPLLDTFEKIENVGAVGPKMLFPNGRLQEAGCRIETDFCTKMIGVFDDPDAPCYNYIREVDYVSGAVLAFKRSDWLEIGGFDDNLAPAFYEDVDLCLALKARGKKIIYNPKSVIVHHLSVTWESIGQSKKMDMIVTNRQKMAEKWQEDVDKNNDVKVIALYFPQFHPNAENDYWWGKGFTEWTNVTKAKPNFEGHLQPRYPGDLGFCDIRLEETMDEQFALAKRYGIHGFCYFYYWFDGTRLLHRAVERMLQREKVLPFCLSWANENWTRRWDGEHKGVMIEQKHSDDDDRKVIRDMIRYMRHPEYIKVNGKPLLFVYRINLFPDIRRTVNIWRETCHNEGIGDIYLGFVESFEHALLGEDPKIYGFDASMEYPPHHAMVPIDVSEKIVNPEFKGIVGDYPSVVLKYAGKPLTGFTRFRGTMTAWDNTARRQNDSVIYHNCSPGAYQAWLEMALNDTLDQNYGDERLVFVNAWNEWAEGTYLEPDSIWGHGFLHSTKSAIDRVKFNRGI
ncbi:MAG: glycoside hydrolase family 99-like domain-containing protein [Planctomycetes bacterium]|nr:glycoside hydrolase family 99-like domain-containing protein [Planctomycetota bacterium]